MPVRHRRTRDACMRRQTEIRETSNPAGEALRPDASQHNRRSRSVRLGLAIAAMALAFWAGRGSASFQLLPWLAARFPIEFGPEEDVNPAVVLRADLDRFGALVNVWNRYMSEHDGELPADPYRVLFYRGGMNDPLELQAYEFSLDLPPRFNPDAPKNRKWVVFARNYWSTAEQWQCYADGTWGRVKIEGGVADAPVGAGMSFGARSELRRAQYPIEEWKSDTDRAAWFARNKARLVWDEPSRMYVVGTRPATRSAAAPER